MPLRRGRGAQRWGVEVGRRSQRCHVEQHARDVPRRAKQAHGPGLPSSVNVQQIIDSTPADREEHD